MTGLPDLALVIRQTDGTSREVASTAAGASVPGLGFLALPRFSPDGRRLAFAAGDGGRVAGDRRPRGGRRGSERSGRAGRWRTGYGAGPGWPDLETGALRQLPTGGHDDLAGIAWLADGERLLLLDVFGPALVTLADGALTRLPGAAAGLAATALAYDPHRS